MEFTKLSENAITPTRGTPESAGLDLYSANDYVIIPQERMLIKTDISIKIPKGYYGRIADRSSMAWKKGAHVIAGVIDSDYRGPVGVVLYNLSKTDIINIKQGERIAQLVITPINSIELHEVSNEDFHSTETERGEGGFGSTGL